MKRKMVAAVLIVSSLLVMGSTLYASKPPECWWTGNEETDIIWSCNYCLTHYGNASNPDLKDVFVWKEYKCPNDPTLYWDLVSWTTTCSYWTMCEHI